MPNYYTSFSQEITDIAPEERSWLEAILKDPDDIDEEEWKAWCDEYWDGPDHAPEHWPSFSYEFEQHNGDVSFWFHSEDSGNVDNAILLVEKFLSRFRPDQELAISWAHTCSRPIIGAYGGGSYTCNAQESTEARWMRSAIDLLERVHYPSANEERDAAIDAAIDAVRKALEVMGEQAESPQAIFVRQAYRFLQEIRPCGDDEWTSAIDTALEAIGLGMEIAGSTVPTVGDKDLTGRPSNRRETGAILAGLRVLQATEFVPGQSSTKFTWSDFGAIYRGNGEFEPLAVDEIDQLCESINFGLILTSCDRREVAAVLAGLRVLQSEMSWTGELYAPTSLTEQVRDILTNGDMIEPLTTDEIDQLSERIGGSSNSSAPDESEE
jgi:hypothetical protein